MKNKIPENYRILVSSCLLNKKLRYDAKILGFHHPFLQKLSENGLLIDLCPESDGGLPTPRIPAELIRSPENIWKTGRGIINKQHEEVTSFFIDGVKKADFFFERFVVEYAVLKEYSPSCGSSYIYDGSFSDTIVPGEGVLAWYLRQNNIKIFSESQIDYLEIQFRQKYDIV